MDINHSVVKDDKGSVTGYSMKVGATVLGSAIKNDTGGFDFSPTNGVAKELKGVKTMRDLKAAIAASLPADFKPEAAAKASKPAAETKAAETAQKEVAATQAAETAAKASADGDIDLD